ncbi:hypothetical protein MP228_010213 [Amoeboaphelidium protococcarum]|nr:hypothetical protein MP228_010213 [Amoeboaphelidium protococcarum]
MQINSLQDNDVAASSNSRRDQQPRNSRLGSYMNGGESQSVDVTRRSMPYSKDQDSKDGVYQSTKPSNVEDRGATGFSDLPNEVHYQIYQKLGQDKASKMNYKATQRQMYLIANSVDIQQYLQRKFAEIPEVEKLFGGERGLVAQLKTRQTLNEEQFLQMLQDAQTLQLDSYSLRDGISSSGPSAFYHYPLSDVQQWTSISQAQSNYQWPEYQAHNYPQNQDNDDQGAFVNHLRDNSVLQRYPSGSEGVSYESENHDYDVYQSDDEALYDQDFTYPSTPKQAGGNMNEFFKNIVPLDVRQSLNEFQQRDNAYHQSVQSFTTNRDSLITPRLTRQQSIDNAYFIEVEAAKIILEFAILKRWEKVITYLVSSGLVDDQSLLIAFVQYSQYSYFTSFYIRSGRLDQLCETSQEIPYFLLVEYGLITKDRMEFARLGVQLINEKMRQNAIISDDQYRAGMLKVLKSVMFGEMDCAQTCTRLVNLDNLTWLLQFEGAPWDYQIYSDGQQMGQQYSNLREANQLIQAAQQRKFR